MRATISAVTKRAEQAQARELRSQGRSVRSIAAELGVAQSSVSVWVRDVLRPPPRPPDAESVTHRRLVAWSSGRARRCPRCALTLPMELFGLQRDGARQGWCRPCFRDHARSRGRAHYEQVRSSKIRRREVARAWLRGHLAEHPCADCGEPDIVVLEFDHTNGKTANVGTLVSNGSRLERIVAEAERCEIVCANCHRRRTAARAGWRRASPTWRLELGALGTPRARNQLYVFEHLATHPCVDCGEDELVVLDFDHVGEKTAAVTWLATYGYSLARIDAEIARCEVRCANCHRRVTSTRAGHFRSTLGRAGATDDGGRDTLPDGPLAQSVEHRTSGKERQ